MLNKNKKRMVKLFLLIFIILFSYNVEGEEVPMIPIDTSVRVPYQRQDELEDFSGG